jgi:phosphatidylglycerol lysyltransferase
MQLVPRLISVLTVVAALVNLASALGVRLSSSWVWVEELYPLGAPVGQSRLLAAGSSFLLLQLALGLARRKRLAWGLSILLLAASSLHQQWALGHGREAALCGLMALLLGLARPVFFAGSDRPSVRGGLVVLLAALLFTVVYGVLGQLWLEHRAGRPFQLTGAVLQTVSLFLDDTPAIAGLPGRAARELAASINALGWLTVSYALLQLLRPVVQRSTPSPGERARVAELVHAEGTLPLAPLALLGGKSYLLSPCGTAALAYGQSGRGAIVLGGPIGSRQAAPALIGRFLELCRRQDWAPAFYQVRPDQLAHFRSLGLRSLQIGEDAVVDLSRFSLAGSAGKRLRPALNKFQRLGYRVELLQRPEAAAMVRLLKPVQTEWLARMGGREKRFSVGFFCEQAFAGAWVGLLRNALGHVEAFVSLHVNNSAAEVSLDMMRSRSLLPSGAMDALFIGVMIELQQLGLLSFNLGLCALKGWMKPAHHPREVSMLLTLAQFLDRRYGLQGLQAFKQKFSPQWEPRYLVYASRSDFPDVIRALMRLETRGCGMGAL